MVVCDAGASLAIILIGWKSLKCEKLISNLDVFNDLYDPLPVIVTISTIEKSLQLNDSP